jgi:hypothetical protein
MNAPITGPGLILGEARNGDDVIAIFRAHKERLGLSNAHVDELANFISGHTDKLIGPTGSKKFGPLTFTALNWTLAVKWVAVIDLDQAKIMEQYWEDRQRQMSHVRAEPSRVSKAIIERAKPHVLRSFSQAGVEARKKQLTGEQKTAIARKGGRARQRKRRQREREARHAAV